MTSQVISFATDNPNLQNGDKITFTLAIHALQESSKYDRHFFEADVNISEKIYNRSHMINNIIIVYMYIMNYVTRFRLITIIR